MTNFKQLPRLKRHETFSIREGWIEKAINIIPNNPNALKKDNGPVEFGLGSNMVKSLRYWLEAADIASFSQGTAELTEFGEVLRRHDRFLNNDFSWLLIHLNIAASLKEDAPVFNMFFNGDYSGLDKEIIVKNMKNAIEDQFGKDSINESSLESDVSVLYRTYFKDALTNPEENLDCPLARLGLVNVRNRKIDKCSLKIDNNTCFAVYYSLIKCFDGSKKISANIEDVFNKDNNPLKLLNLSKSALFLMLEELKQKKLISFIKTAGLNTIEINKILTIEELYTLSEED